ncbi:arginine N-succinyltransferase [Paraferrimonas sedimenticola]|uniref:Arginine N-succinyltransferase n=1 Tax=Paraferrimonas sedimenticola TaxID=375674 RepID=A0AA37RVX9_9GAMM|nr:arginine N-succinyltransferase [Paraferrimonas sedimenticola]GLP95792.1 arginine N-succinyltransferase [Paraferrimonas sedimenticola]
MIVIRPICSQDLDALMRIAEASGHGFTSLPLNRELLERKIRRSEASFSTEVAGPHDEGYLMVMEDTETGEVVGTSAIEAAVGLVDAFYHYRVGTEVYHSEKLGVRNEVETLTMCHDYTGAAELCTLFLDKNYRHSGNGRLLSKHRFLFLAQHPHRFGERVIAEMRGVCDEHGQSPFYDWLQKHFFSIDFPYADYLSGMGEKSFMAELMPRNPIYTCLLSPEAQEVISRVHPNTRPALKLLEAEGLRYRGYVDIFDAGPTVECQLTDIVSVRNSQLYTVQIGEPVIDRVQAIAANTKLVDYRAANLEVGLDDGETAVWLSEAQAQALKVEAGEPLRLLIS